MTYSQGYEVSNFLVAVTGGAPLKVCALANDQQYSDPDGTAAAAGVSEACWPLFGQVWPSSRVLAALMQTWEVEGRSILEIGCGLGLASMVVQRRSGDITATDYHPLAETFLRFNARLNGIRPIRFVEGDWEHDMSTLGQFDLIVGSDVLYQRSHPLHLARFLNAHAAQHAEVLIVDPNRGNVRKFANCMANHRFSMSETAIDCEFDTGEAYRGRFLQFAR